ncbi:MAG: carboxypeptidase-like regulatory domain-containing protein [Betaproteobacteria bacterium]
MRSVLLAFALAGLALASPAAEPRVNVVTEGIRGIKVAEPADACLLVVFVVDDAGDPVDEVPVRVTDRGREVASARSDNRGRAILRLPRAGRVSVSAVDAGFVRAVAHGVAVRRGGLTSVALPLEQEEPAQ